ncbi:MAG: Gldg family protein, partial [Psychroflexus sp.]
MKSSFNFKYLLGLILVLCLINFGASSVFERFDFTEDQRYTLSETSLEITSKIEKPVIIQVFLKGDLPSEFSRLRRETRYILEEFAAYNSNVKFEFVNPVGENEDA